MEETISYPITTVVWKDEDTGTIRVKYSKDTGYTGPVHSRKHCLEQLLTDNLRFTIIHGDLLEDLEIFTSKIHWRIPVVVGYMAYDCHPRFTITNHMPTKDFLNSMFMKAITNFKSNIQDVPISKHDSDFLFLAKTNMKRKFNQDCVMCHTDKIMGTTCTCGHTETAVFRPCGHAICARPCFKDWMEFKKKSLAPKLLKSKDGTQFVVRDEHNIEMKLSKGELECPTCRTGIESVFQAEESYPTKKDMELFDFSTEEIKAYVSKLF